MAAFVGFALLLGLVVGSFLNVVIWRVPRGESVVAPASHCPGCGVAIAVRDNIPVFSWLWLRGRCRNCASAISARYPVVEGITGVLFALLAARIGFTWALPAYLYLAAVGVALAFIDFDTKRLPNALTLSSYPVVAGLLLLPAALDDRWDQYFHALIGGAILFGCYLLAAVLFPAGMGMGDVKLAGVLGMGLAWFGWGVLVVGGFAAFLFGAVVGLALISRGRAGRRTAIPFGPFMVAGTLVALFVGPTLTDWYAGLLAG